MAVENVAQRDHRQDDVQARGCGRQGEDGARGEDDGRSEHLPEADRQRVEVGQSASREGEADGVAGDRQHAGRDREQRRAVDGDRTDPDDGGHAGDAETDADELGRCQRLGQPCCRGHGHRGRSQRVEDGGQRGRDGLLGEARTSRTGGRC